MALPPCKAEHWRIQSPSSWQLCMCPCSWAACHPLQHPRHLWFGDIPSALPQYYDSLLRVIQSKFRWEALFLTCMIFVLPYVFIPSIHHPWAGVCLIREVYELEVRSFVFKLDSTSWTHKPSAAVLNWNAVIILVLCCPLSLAVTLNISVYELICKTQDLQACR